MKILRNVPSWIWSIVALLAFVDRCQAFVGTPISVVSITRYAPLSLPPSSSSPGSSLSDVSYAGGGHSKSTIFTTRLQLFNNNDDGGKDEATIEEEARLRIWESRRGQIRSTLKSAEGLRNFRIKNGTFWS